MLINSTLFSPVNLVLISNGQVAPAMDWVSHVVTWPVIAGAAGVIAAFAIFVRDMLTIEKLRAEIRALKEAEKAKTEVIRIATLEEIDRYAQRSPRRAHHFHSLGLWNSAVENVGLVLLVGELISGPALAVWLLLRILGLSPVVAEMSGSVGCFCVVLTGVRMLIDRIFTKARYDVLYAELESACDAAYRAAILRAE